MSNRGTVLVPRPDPDPDPTQTQTPPGPDPDPAAPDLDLNVDPESLSYLVASVMAIEMPEKQQLLELSGVFERLRKEATILARENRALQTFIYLQGQRQDPPDQTDFTPRISLN